LTHYLYEVVKCVGLVLKLPHALRKSLDHLENALVGLIAVSNLVFTPGGVTKEIRVKKAKGDDTHISSRSSISS